MSIFNPALKILSSPDVGIYGPTSFQKYLVEHNLRPVNTAQYISIDTFERLDTALKASDVMVLRMGASEDGKSTQFVLAKVADSLRDFFIFDNSISSIEFSTFLPTASFRQLYPYQLLALHSETALVNLGFVSGLIARALNLDENEQLIFPATGQSIFSFEFKAHQLLDEKLSHNRGQVQVDALFIGRRNNKEILFIVEAKCGSETKSLAKHKLVYPILALAKKVPRDIEIVPVYLRIIKIPEGFVYSVTECIFPDPRTSIRAIDELKVLQDSSFLLPLSIVSS